LRNIDEITYVFSFFRIFTAVKHIFRNFTGVLRGYFLLSSANIQNVRESLLNCDVKKEKNLYIQVFPINTGFIFILCYENYQINRGYRHS
jgi:hypothetical protein